MNLKKIFFIFLFTYNSILPKTDSDLIQINGNVKINWTKGIIYSEYSLFGESGNLDKTEKETYEKALHNLYLAIYDLYFESTITVKNKIQEDEQFKKIMYYVPEHIRIEKKIKYLNTITYTLSFAFLDFFEYYLPAQKENEDLKESYVFPIRKERYFKGILIYINKEIFKPALRLKIYSSNGKLILILPSKKNTFYRSDHSDTPFYKDNKLDNPYIIYTKKTLNFNDIIIDHKDIQFLIANRNLYNPDLIKIILYDNE